MNRQRLLNLRFYRQHPRLRAALYRRCFGLRASLRRNMRVRRKGGIRSWFAAVFAALFARQVASRYTARPHAAWQSTTAPVTRRRWKRASQGKGGPIIRLSSGRGETARYRIEQGPNGYRFAKWTGESRLRMADRFGYDVDAHGSLRPMTSDDRRKLRNARKAERRAS